MALYSVTSIDIGSGYRVSTDASNIDYIITGNAVLGSTDGSALSLRGSSHDVLVEGTVVASSVAVVLGGTGTSGNRLHVSDGGMVQGFTAVSLSSGGLVSNKGEIVGANTGVLFMGNSYTGGSVINDGTISAGSYGILSSIEGSSYATIVNRGTVSGMSYGIFSVGTTGNIQRVTNYGSISGDANAYESYSITDLLTNRGEIRGGVKLGVGNDLYDGRGGRIVDGVVHGEEGDDRFMAGDGEETFDGGAGIDMLDFRSSAGLRVSLMDDSGSGAALGDTYTNIERVIGSRYGADTLIGDGAANILEGKGGADRLLGGDGADRLIGGAEADKLSGGAGNDRFVFATRGQGGDTIADWGRATGNDDAFEIAVGGFGGGLVAGTLASSRFVARLSDNLAQDADDRFVFRKDNATLWWDADGKGGAAAVMIADLQTGAVVTASDILLV